MTLNFSHRPVFPAHISEDNLVSPIRITNGCHVEGVSERNRDEFVRTWCSDREVEDSFEYGRDRGGTTQESNDILDVLPSDPFGMDISTTFTAITGWLEDLEVDYGGYGMVEAGSSRGDYELFAGFNIIWSNAMRFQSLPCHIGINDVTERVGGSVGHGPAKEVLDDSPCHDGFGVVANVENILGSDGESGGSVVPTIEEVQLVSKNYVDGDGGAPHPALHFALDYLGIQDLLSVERVCKTLRSTVKSDPLLWRSIHIDQPLNERITDDILLLLTSRAQGNLQCLSLLECSRITDDGLKHVLQNNPRLTKLSVPGCTRLSIEGIVNSLKDFSFSGTQRIKHLRIGGLYGVTQKHFEELNMLLDTCGRTQRNARKPHFYRRGNLYLSCDDDRAIDVEVCPRCENLRLVYDCPAESCQGDEEANQLCRACALCIARCYNCGCCINDSEYEETFCLELLCSNCLKQQLKYQAKQNVKVGPSNHAALPESCDSSLHG